MTSAGRPFSGFFERKHARSPDQEEKYPKDPNRQKTQTAKRPKPPQDDVKTRKSQNLYKKKVKRPRRYKKKVII